MRSKRRSKRSVGTKTQEIAYCLSLRGFFEAGFSYAVSRLAAFRCYGCALRHRAKIGGLKLRGAMRRRSAHAGSKSA